MKKITKLLTTVSVLFVSAFNLNAQCYTPTYTNRTNLLPEAQMDNVSLWTTSWGTTGKPSLETTSPYCGTNSIKIGDGVNTCWPAGGSLATPITWQPNTNYRVRGWFKADAGKKFNIYLGRVYTAGANVNGHYDEIITATGAWQEVDFTFITGASAGTVAGEIAVNSCGITASAERTKNIYVDNFELYNMDVTLSVDDVLKNDSGIRLLSNPVGNTLNIETELKIASVSIYDILGRAVLSKDNTNESNLKSIDVSMLNSGTYIARFVVENKAITLKFIK